MERTLTLQGFARPLMRPLAKVWDFMYTKLQRFSHENGHDAEKATSIPGEKVTSFSYYIMLEAYMMGADTPIPPF